MHQKVMLLAFTGSFWVASKISRHAMYGELTTHHACLKKFRPTLVRKNCLPKYFLRKKYSLFKDYQKLKQSMVLSISLLICMNKTANCMKNVTFKGLDVFQFYLNHIFHAVRHLPTISSDES